MLAGPNHTLIAGFANGLLGIWSMKTGVRIHDVQLHGPVRHLVLQGTRLYVATTLGDHRVLDLGVFQQPYCELLRELWRAVPVVWQAGRPVADPPPADHQCSK